MSRPIASREERSAGSQAPLLLGAVLLSAVIWAPLLSSGHLFLLDFADYPTGPHPHLGSYVWGLPPGLTSRAPINALLVGLFSIISWPPLRVLPMALSPLLVVWGFSRLFDRKPIPTLTATFFYVVNPFMVDRMVAGQIYLVIGISLFPLFMALLFAPAPDYSILQRGLRIGLTLALMIALAPHFVFLAGLPLAVVLCGAVVKSQRRRAAAVLLSLGAAIGLGLYWILPAIRARSTLSSVGAGDLATFATRADSHRGLLVNALGLYGFWIRMWREPKDVFTWWPVLLLAILVVVIVGAAVALRDPKSRPAAIVIIASAILGYLLALGGQGPSAGIYLWLFDHVPVFRIMREPQKFLVLVLFAYAYFFALGAVDLLHDLRGRARALFLVGLEALIVMNGFTVFWGFNGYVHPSSVPSSWAAADRQMGVGDGSVLSLPWRLYEVPPFTDDREVANPTPSFFRRQTIVSADSGDPVANQNAGPIDRYISFLVSRGAQIDAFGNLVAPLNVRYVLLQHVQDWQAYSWLFDQRDLQVVGTWGDLTLFRNSVPTAPAYTVSRTIDVADWGQLIGLSRQVDLTAIRVRVARASPGPIRASEPVTPAIGDRTLDGSSAGTGFTLAEPARGPITFAREFDGAWQMGGDGAIENMGVTNAFPRAEGERSITYGRWAIVRAGYAVSLSALLVVLLMITLPARRRRRGDG
jgi:hypothetical protein